MRPRDKRKRDLRRLAEKGIEGRKDGLLRTLRLDWRDPSMPVIRDYRMPNGSRKVEVDPDYERRYREFLISTTAEPGYRKDPTYNMRKK